jgi:ADP-ribose pyrophosphatase YjhB (NUDIX family)
VKFCSECGGGIELRIPEGDDRDRFVCAACGHIHYINPRVIVGCLPIYGEQVLLCKRAIQPRLGFWTLPAGFMENGETTAEGAARETWEEAMARVSNMHLYRVFDVPYINQVYLFYRCTVDDGLFGIGPESSDTALCTQDEIPWDELAFPVVRETLKAYYSDRLTGDFPVAVESITWRRPRPE